MRKVIIMRGVSGSGKSTMARSLASNVESSLIVSADDYFMRQGSYQFNPKQLREAHDSCRVKFEAALAADVGLVIVDNTNTQKWEYLPYENLARDYNYSVSHEVVGSTDQESLVKYAERNVHKVPLNVIQRQAQRFDV